MPHGSLLGPLFFIFYINDLPNVSDIIETILFADDIRRLFYSHSNIQQLNDTLNSELSKFDCWMKANKLSVNIKKTIMWFSNQNKKESILICHFRLMVKHLKKNMSLNSWEYLLMKIYHGHENLSWTHYLYL